MSTPNDDLTKLHDTIYYGIAAIGMRLLFIVIWCVVADVITVPAQFTVKK